MKVTVRDTNGKIVTSLRLREHPQTPEDQTASRWRYTVIEPRTGTPIGELSRHRESFSGQWTVPGVGTFDTRNIALRELYRSQR